MIFRRIERKLDEIKALLWLVLRAEVKSMEGFDTKIQPLIDATTNLTTKVDSFIAFNAGMKQLLIDALAATGLTAEQQAVIDQTFALVGEKAAEITTAIDAGTT